MTHDLDFARYSDLETRFASILESPAPERARLLELLEESDAALAREVRELVEAHERRIPVLDEPPVPALGPPGGEFSMIGASLGGWRITGHIGRGGWADVYEARQGVPDRTCALKVLRWPWLCTPRTLQRFRDEADLLARVEHPAIARVYGAGVASVAGVELPYLAMELVPDAVPITKHAWDRRLALGERLRLFMGVCDGVHCAHRRGVLHRDLKPSNILVGSDARARVIDFGVACAMDHAGAAMTWSGEFIGTIGYMSPERLATGTGSDGRAPEPPDARWDVYSLGIILYELVTGKSAYSLPADVASSVALVQRSAPLAPRAADPSLPIDLCTIIETAIERDPLRRYQSVAEVAADLQRFLTARPITARPTPLRRRVRLAARRNPALAAALACSCVGAAAVLATALRGWESTREELRATELSLGVLDDAMATARSRRDGDTVRISDLLGRLERPLDSAEPPSPRVAARLHDIVGRTYEDLADYDAAHGHYEAGLAAARRVWGESDAMVVRLRVELAGSLYDRGDPQGAARMLEELLATAGRLEPDVLGKVKNDLAVAYMKAEQWIDAERVGVEAYSLRVAALGEGDPASVQSLINLGANALHLGRLETARERLSKGLDRARALGREGARAQVHALSYLGLTLAQLGEHDGSRGVSDEAAALLPQLVGRDHPTYLKLSLVWAGAALERGDAQAAIDLAHDVAARAPVVFGEDHPETAGLLQRAGAIASRAMVHRASAR